MNSSSFMNLSCLSTRPSFFTFPLFALLIPFPQQAFTCQSMPPKTSFSKTPRKINRKNIEQECMKNQMTKLQKNMYKLFFNPYTFLNFTPTLYEHYNRTPSLLGWTQDLNYIFARNTRKERIIQLDTPQHDEKFKHIPIYK